MTSNRPYLIRALYQWIVDNDMTPHVLIDADFEEVHVPKQYVQEGKIVLNIAPMAVQSLILGNDEITFSARFGGVPMDVYAPMDSVLAIYARENGQGMMFAEEPRADDDEPPPDPEAPGPADAGDSGPRLKVVK